MKSPKKVRKIGKKSVKIGKLKVPSKGLVRAIATAPTHTHTHTLTNDSHTDTKY